MKEISNKPTKKQSKKRKGSKKRKRSKGKKGIGNRKINDLIFN